MISSDYMKKATTKPYIVCRMCKTVSKRHTTCRPWL